MTVSLSSLLVQATKAEIYAQALAIAENIGLPVSSWQPGDPTRSYYHVLSEVLATVEEIVAGYVSSGFLDYASGTWLKILAKQVYNVDVPEATYATAPVTLTNSGGGVYDFEVGDLTFKSSLSEKTYRLSALPNGGHLAAGGTLEVTVTADEAGSDSSAGVGEIDTLVTTLLGVTCTNTTAAVGTDEQDEDTTRQQCRDRLGALSPNGPMEAYSYVVRNSELTGTTVPTRCRVFTDSEIGQVTVYVAGAAGALSNDDLTLVETAVATYATPLCVTPLVYSASNVPIAITYEIWIYRSVNKTEAQVKEGIEDALTDLFASRPIGGDIIAPATTGAMYQSLIESVIRSTYPETFRVSLSAPASDTSLTNGQVATLGTITATVNFVDDP